MERSKKNIIGYMILVIVFALFVLYAYIDAKPRREAKQAQKAVEVQQQACEREAQTHASDAARSVAKYLPSTEDQIKHSEDLFYANYFKKCMNDYYHKLDPENIFGLWETETPIDTEAEEAWNKTVKDAKENQAIEER